MRRECRERFSRPQGVSDPDMHHGTRVTHVPWCMLGSINRGFLWNRWRGKCCRRSRCMRNPQFYVSGKRPMPLIIIKFVCVCVNIRSLLKHDLFIFYDGWHRNIICSIETYINKDTDIFIGFYVPINQNKPRDAPKYGNGREWRAMHLQYIDAWMPVRVHLDIWSIAIWTIINEWVWG